MNVDVKINPAYYPYLEDNRRTQVFFGGSSSGKSYFLAQRIILDLLKGERNYLVIRNVMATVRLSTFNELKKAISTMQVDRYFKVNGSTFTITCLLNNKQIIFYGCDNIEKIKSVTAQDGAITDIFIEEATELNYESYKQLRKRLRGRSSVPKRITLAFNPIVKSHWIYKEFFGKWQDDKTKYEDDELLIVKTTYKDNLFLEEDDIRELENEKDPYFYNVYTLGNWGVLGKVVFKNWETRDLSDIKQRADRCRYGIDFGFSVDPTAFIKVYYSSAQKTIYVLDEFYITNLNNDDMAALLRQKVGKGYVICDSVEPRTINELRSRGINAIGAKKGPDSLRHGISWLQQQKIVVDVSCEHLKNELQLYHWQEDRFGNTLPIPVDRDNHLIDALRYCCEDLMTERRITSGKRL